MIINEKHIQFPTPRYTSEKTSRVDPDIKLLLQSALGDPMIRRCFGRRRVKAVNGRWGKMNDSQVGLRDETGKIYTGK